MNMNTIDFRQLLTVLKKGRPVILWLDDERDPMSEYPTRLGYDPGEYRPTYVEGVVGKCNDSKVNRWDVIWVKDYEGFVEYIDNHGIPDVICFDHDLGGQMTGKDCANYLVEKLMDMDEIGPIIRSQSSNPAGAANILNLLGNWREHYVRNHPEQFNKQ